MAMWPKYRPKPVNRFAFDPDAPLSRKAAIARIFRNEQYSSPGYSTYFSEKKFDGNLLWTVHCTVHKRSASTSLSTWNEGVAKGTRIKLFILFKKENGEWDYKVKFEGHCDGYYSCPLEFLERAPPINDHWREKVRRWHAEQARFESGAAHPTVSSRRVSNVHPTRDKQNHTTAMFKLGPTLSSNHRSLH